MFGDEDRKNVTASFEIVREIADTRDYKDADYISSLAVVQLLSQIPYYSQISERTMRRWYSLKSNVNKKPGRKINESYESEIWGNLMMCVTEKSTDEACEKMYSVFTICFVHE